MTPPTRLRSGLSACRPAPRPIAAGRTARCGIAFDRTYGPWRRPGGKRIVFGDDVKAGDRKACRSRAIRRPIAARSGSPRPASRGAGPDPGHRPALPGHDLCAAPAGAGRGRTPYRLRGVEASGRRPGSRSRRRGLVDRLDSGRRRSGLRRGGSIGEPCVKSPGKLVLKTLVALPKGKATLSFAASRPVHRVGTRLGIEQVADRGAAERPSYDRGRGRRDRSGLDARSRWGDAARPSRSTPGGARRMARTAVHAEQLILPWAPPSRRLPPTRRCPAVFLSGRRPGEGGRALQGGSGQVRDLPPGPRRGGRGRAGPERACSAATGRGSIARSTSRAR